MLTDSQGHYLFATDPSINTQPTTASQTVTFPNTPTGQQQTGTFNQFDSSLGTLLSVDFINNAALNTDMQIESKDKAPSAKLAAREKALTQMRTYRKVLLENPIHTQLADPANPFADSSKVRAAARGILVALKRIELETLIGV